MLKNFILLILLSWVTLSHAEVTIARESMEDAETFKVEEASSEQEAQSRSVAGSKIKKKKNMVKGDGASKTEVTTEPDSEVRYWQYSE